MRRLRAHRTARQSASTRNEPWADPSPSAVCPRSLRSWERKEAVRQASRIGPDTVLWPIGFLVDRLRRRLAETHGAVLEAVAADSLGRQVAHRRRAGVFGAANLGRTWGTAGVDVEDAESWIKVEFGDADEAAAQGSSVVQRRLRRRGTLETAMIPAESSLALAGGAPPSSRSPSGSVPTAPCSPLGRSVGGHARYPHQLAPPGAAWRVRDTEGPKRRHCLVAAVLGACEPLDDLG